MSKDSQPIIIKKKIKKGEHGHHGGAWKVAYADFITALMALFLVLWLVAMLSIETRNAVAQYFRSYTIFKGMEAGGGKGVSIMMGNPVKLEKESGDVKMPAGISDKLSFELGKTIKSRLYDLKDQILIFTTTDGVRLEIVDKEGRPMFEKGRARLLNTGQEVLRVIAQALKDMPYTITIEGHTDSTQFSRDKDYTNWELAADRANAARRELIKNGLDPKRITKVTSFADVVSLNPRDPYDPINRRVSILIEKNRLVQDSPSEGLF